MTPPFEGLHHVSLLSADIARNHDFYTRVLGLRLVKKTVNQDSPGMYHLFYADGAGTPGTEVTFFDFPRAAREHRGADAITLITLRVSGEQALTAWAARLDDLEVPRGEVHRRDGRAHLDFEDPDGTRLSLVDDGGEGPRAESVPGSDLSDDDAIQGLGYSVLTVRDPAPTRDFLRRGLGLEVVREYAQDGARTLVYALNPDGGAHAELHLSIQPDLPRAKPGAGSAHHIALRVPDEAALRGWMAHLDAQGYGHSGFVDRYYFRSVYIRDPNGLTIELATDGPGFAADEAPDSLGERLALPPFLEPRRATIEAHLRPLALMGDG